MFHRWCALQDHLADRLQIGCMLAVSATLPEHGRFTRREASWSHFAIVKFPSINLFPQMKGSIRQNVAARSQFKGSIPVQSRAKRGIQPRLESCSACGR